MKLGSIKENLNLEQRIAITPDIIKKYKSLGLTIVLPKSYGDHLGIPDLQFQNEGAEILENEEKVLEVSDAIFNFLTELAFDALAIILRSGFSSLAVSTTNKLSASEGKVVINALAFSIPHFTNSSSLVASPSAQFISVCVLK